MTVDPHDTHFWHPFADMGAVRGSEFVIERGEDVWVWDKNRPTRIIPRPSGFLWAGRRLLRQFSGPLEHAVQHGHVGRRV